MLNRIFNKMSLIIKKFPNNITLFKKNQLISKNTITTIDSFCYNTIKENYELCGVSHNFKIVSETEINKTKDEILDYILKKEYEKNKQNFKNLADYFSLNSIVGLKEAILKIYDKSQTMPFPEEYLKDLLNPYINPTPLLNSDIAKEIVEQICSKLENINILFKTAKYFLKEEILKKNFEPYLDENILKITKLKNKIKTLKYDDILKELNDFKFLSSPKYDKEKNSFDKEIAKEIKTKYIYPAKKILNSLKENFITEEEYLKVINIQKNIIKKLINLTQKFSKKLETMKLKKNILEFSDLIIKTLKLLVCFKNKKLKLTNFGKKFTKKFNEILVDEYQDINKAQDLLLKILSNDINLFVVGDLKQSIYGFRQADPKIFIDKKNEYSKDNNGSLIYLNKNFRSRKEITNSVNLIFNNMMTLDFGKVNYEKTEQLISNFNNIPSKKENETEIHIIKNSTKEENLDFELSHVANIIKNMLDSKFKVTDENGDLRACQPKDFAVLLRSGLDITKNLCEKLEKLKIDYVSYNEINFLKSYEISLLTSLLKIINNPLLDIPFSAVAFSPMFCFENSEILEISNQNKELPLYIAFKKTKNTKCKILINYLKELKNKATTLTLEELIEEIYASNIFLKIFAKYKFDEIKQNNLEKFLEIASNYDQYFEFGLSGFLSYINTLKDDKISIKINNNIKNSNSVNILTIHKSKGLEFPIVIIPLNSKKFNEQDFNQPILISSKFKIALKHSNKKNLSRFNSLIFNATIYYEKKMLKEEELRLLYVAMTRAKEKLILTAVDDKDRIKTFKKIHLSDEYFKNKNCFLDWFLPIVLNNKNNNNKSLNKNESFCNISIKTEFEKETEKEKKEINQKIEYFNFKKLTFLKKQLDKKPKQLNKQIPSKLSVTEILKLETKNLDDDFKMPDFEKNKNPSPSDIGTAMHLFLQYANFKNAENDLELEIKRLLKKEYITKFQEKYLNITKLKKFFSSKTYNIIKKADKIKREQNFLVAINANKILKTNCKDKILVQGIIDCIIEKNDKLILIDYKTDRVNEKTLIKRYFKQIKLYELLIKKMYDKKVSFSIIHSINLNKTIII